jgi:polyisoprenoid-binding protein YceI
MTMTTEARAREFIGAGSWLIDPQRSTVGFAIRHFGVALVRGRFSEFSGTLERDEHGTRIAAVVRTASIDTGNQLRDDRVRGAGYLDDGAHPEIRFVSEEIVPARAGAVLVSGRLSIAGVTRPAVLKAVALAGRDPDRIRITARGTVRRSDFRIEPPSLLESGVSDRVDLVLDVEAERVHP